MATLWLLVYRSAYSRVYRSSKITEIYEPLSQQYQRLDIKIWLPFLKTYRTICLAPSADFRRMLEDVRELGLAA
jgi:hypothetical protein